MARLLVTGGAHFIGSDVVFHATSRYPSAEVKETLVDYLRLEPSRLNSKTVTSDSAEVLQRETNGQNAVRSEEELKIELFVGHE